MFAAKERGWKLSFNNQFLVMSLLVRNQ